MLWWRRSPDTADALGRAMNPKRGVGARLVKAVTSAAFRWIRRSPLPVSVLDLPTVMSFFTSGRRPPGAVAGVAARTARGSGYTVLLAYLDASGKVMTSGRPRPPTRSYLAYRLADDLRELFGDRDVIVLD